MCIDFDGHHSGGSSFDSVIRCGPYPQVPVGFYKKKKNQVRSPSPESRVPETGWDPPIGSDRESGHDKLVSEPRFRRFWKSLRLRMYLHRNVLA